MIGTMKMQRMIGTMKINNFNDLFEAQAKNQNELLNRGKYGWHLSGNQVPFDDVALSSYHVQQLISEIGEVLQADKRWKNFRNEYQNEDEKLKEIADCFIVLMNVAMYSGFDAEQLYEAIANKITEVSKRIKQI